MITVFEIVHSPILVWVVFVFAWGYSIFGYYFLYDLAQQFEAPRPNINQEHDSDINVAKRTVVLENIPSFLSTKECNDVMNGILKEKYGKKFIAASTLGDYKKLYQLCRERIKLASDLNKFLVNAFENPNQVLLY